MKKLIIRIAGVFLFIGVLAFNAKLTEQSSQGKNVDLDNIETLAADASDYPYETMAYCGWFDLDFACTTEQTATACTYYECLVH